MTDHLSDEQLSAALLAADDTAAAEHLAGCEDCRFELERMRAALAGVHAESLRRAEHPPLFWREQRQAIASRMPAGREIETRPLAWAGSLAMVAVAAAWLMQSAPPAPPQANRMQGATSVSAPVDPDHALLVEIQRSVRRDVPRALEPATLLAQELHRAANRKSDR
jgi:hypothetical protein